MKYNDFPKVVKVIVLIFALIFPLFIYMCLLPIMLAQINGDLHGGPMLPPMLYSIGIVLLFLYDHIVLTKVLKENYVWVMEIVMMVTIVISIFPPVYKMPLVLVSIIEFIFDLVFEYVAIVGDIISSVYKFMTILS